MPDDRAGHRGRLRQRFRQTGRKGLADYELLELLLSFAIARRDVKPLAKDLIRRFGSLPAAALNGADSGDKSSDNRDAAEALVDLPQFEFIDAPIRRRKSFANAAGQGLSIFELKPSDKKASDELEKLISIVF